MAAVREKEGGKKKDAVVQKSPAEFFAENKNIAGFDNVRLAHSVVHAPPSCMTHAMQLTHSRRLRKRTASRSCVQASCERVLLLHAWPLHAWTLHALPACLSVLQPGKCLYTTIRELVENALDAAESISQLPHIEITM